MKGRGKNAKEYKPGKRAKIQQSVLRALAPHYE